MTVGSRVKQTLVSLKGSEAVLEAFSIHHPDEATKALFNDCLVKIQAITGEIENRVQEIEFEEPQFKGN